MTVRTTILTALISATTLISCKNSNKPTVDVSHVQVSLTSQPFYKDFSALDTLNFGAGLTSLKSKYPQFLDFYLDTLLPFNPVTGKYEDVAKTANIKNILTHKDYAHLLDTVNQVFPTTEKMDAEIKQMLQHVKFYLPSWTTPNEVFYFVSCLNRWTAFTKDSILGIGLDMFLGQDFKPYEVISMPKYALINHTPDHVAIWAAKAIYQGHTTTDQNLQDLLQLMIAQGKELFFLNKVLANVPEEHILGYTKEQWDWCMKNEALVYNLFLQQNLLYSKDYQSTMRYVTPGVNSAGFPPEAPGNLGSFIGYRILQTYENKTGAQLADILNNKDANAIFQQSNYKP